MAKGFWSGVFCTLAAGAAAAMAYKLYKNQENGSSNCCCGCTESDPVTETPEETVCSDDFCPEEIDPVDLSEETQDEPVGMEEEAFSVDEADPEGPETEPEAGNED